MENFERKFNVNPEGEAEEEKLPEKDRLENFKKVHETKGKVIFRKVGNETRRFVVDENGEAKIEELDKDKKES